MSKSESKTKKKADSSKPASVTDVAHPNTSTPSDTSKPIITHRPMIKDPMMVDGKAQPETEPEEEKLPIKKTGEAKLKPLDDTAPQAAPDDGADNDEAEKPEKPEEAGADSSDSAEETKDAEDDAGSDKAGKTGKTGTEPKTKPETEPEEDPKIRKLIESKKYFLPLNAVEHRRSARFAAVGVILALVLAAAWVNVALDAGLIHIDGIKPVTHLFSN